MSSDSTGGDAGIGSTADDGDFTISEFDDLWADLESSERHAFITRMGANAAIVRVWPEEATGAVAQMARQDGFGVTEPDNRTGWATFFEEEDFADERMGELADALTARGVHAFAYALLRADRPSARMNVFRRIGGRRLDGAHGVVFSQLALGPADGGFRELTGWIFGPEADLEALEKPVSRRFTLTRDESFDGLDALHLSSVVIDDDALRDMVTLDAADDEPAEVNATQLIRDLCEILSDAGMGGPMQVFDIARRDEGDDPS